MRGAPPDRRAAFFVYRAQAMMKRILALWLTLLGAFWLTRELTSALLFQRVEQGTGALAELLLVPALQTAVIAWLTRGRKS
jgi:hypothetical protein